MTCKVEGCNSSIAFKEMCGKHYKRWWRHGDTSKSREKTGICVAPDCGKPKKIKDYCKIHYNRIYKNGRFHTVVAKKGEGRPRTSAGYVLLNKDGRRVYEHIYLAEQVLGKPLPTGAHVHHMNERKDDNFTPFNLIVCPDAKYHRLLHTRAFLLTKGLL